MQGAKLMIFAAQNYFLSYHPRHIAREGCPAAALPLSLAWASVLPLLQESPPGGSGQLRPPKLFAFLQRLLLFLQQLCV